MESKAVLNFKDNFYSLFGKLDKNYYSHVDGLRAISLIWVVVFHMYWFLGYILPVNEYEKVFNNPYNLPIFSGTYAVDVFFVISGFLVGKIIFTEVQKEKQFNLKNFYLRRALRLLPMYYLALILLMLITDKNREHVWTNFLYINNYIPIQEQFMVWSWSLAIEEHFYIFFPLFVLFFNPLKRYFLWICMSLMVIWIGIRYSIMVDSEVVLPLRTHPKVNPESYFVYFNEMYGVTHARYGSILAGVIVAWLFQFTNTVQVLSKNALLRRSLSIISAAIFIGLCCTSLSDTPQIFVDNSVHFLVWFRPLFALSISYMIIYPFTEQGKNGFLARFLSVGFFRPIARVSYSAYLIHTVLIGLCFKFIYMPVNGENQLILVPFSVLILFVVFVVSALFYSFWEKPFIDLRKFWKFEKKDAANRKPIESR